MIQTTVSLMWSFHFWSCRTRGQWWTALV